MNTKTKQSIRANAKTQEDYYKGDEGNKTKQEHTPTPWNVTKDSHPDMEGSIWIDSKTIEKPALCFNEADAAFIVRAVNSHEELLEACKEIVRYMKNETDNPEAVYDRVEQAIANAERKQ